PGQAPGAGRRHARRCAAGRGRDIVRVRPADHPPLARAGGNGVSDRTCLLADDHPAVIAFVRGVIEEYGLEIVGPASTGPETLALAREHEPAVALIDLRM